MKPWHIRDPLGFDQERADVEGRYPHLHVHIVGDEIRIAGTMPIVDGATELDRFQLEITLPIDYPDAVPIVVETGGRVPRTPDRHCNPADGTACVMLPEDRWRVWPVGSTLLQFIDGPVLQYLIGQATVERGDPWPFGEWSHGEQGQREYYKEVFQTDELPKVRTYLEFIIAKKAKGHWDCPCGSGRRLRDCHGAMVYELRDKMPRTEARKSLGRLPYPPSMPKRR